MLEMEADGQAASGSARRPAGIGPVTAPDREVLDSARSRLDAQHAAAGPGPLHSAPGPIRSNPSWP